MLRTRGTLTLLAAVTGGLAMMIFAGPVAGAQPVSSASTVVATTGEAAGFGQMTLPHRTIRQADGTVMQIATQEAVRAATAKATMKRLTSPSSIGIAAVYGCGYTCDDKDPDSYQYAGQTCSSDAYTMASVTQGAGTAELRFSSWCQTAWTRSCCYVRGGGFGYTGSGVERKWVYNGNGVYSGSPTWTRMLYDGSPTTYKACFDRILTGSGHDWNCSTEY